MRKRLLGSIVLLAFLSLPCYSAPTSIVTLDKKNLEKPEIITGEVNKNLKGSLLINDSETLATMIDEQKEHDLKDLERLWQGTVEEFFELFTVAAKHLKNRFPHLKIGGPGSAGDEEWMERFFIAMKKNNVPLDFFSYHWYWTQPYDMTAKCTRVRKLLDKSGYAGVETNLDEWNYVRGWEEDFVYSIKQIIGIKGAAFNMACMSAAQNCPDIDMLMYYDARPSEWNGLFDFYTMEPLKGYYAFYTFANLYEMGQQVESYSDDESVYVVGAKGNGKYGIAITYYSENDNDCSKKIALTLDGLDLSKLKFYLVDENNTYAEKEIYLAEDNQIIIHLERNSIMYIEM